MLFLRLLHRRIAFLDFRRQLRFIRLRFQDFQIQLFQLACIRTGRLCIGIPRLLECRRFLALLFQLLRQQFRLLTKIVAVFGIGICRFQQFHFRRVPAHCLVRRVQPARKLLCTFHAQRNAAYPD